MSLSLAALALALTAALVAAFVRGLAGFGMAILLVPLLALIVAPGEAVVVSNLLGLLIGLVGVRGVLAECDRRSVGPIAGWALLATPAGLLLLAATPPALARLLIALAAMLGFALVLLPPRRHDHRPPPIETAATGLGAGLLTGFAGMPGIPVVPYYLRQPIPAARARASMMAVFLATSLASSVAALALGLAHLREAGLALLLFVPVLLGNRLGSRAFGRVSERAWRLLVALLLLASAAGALLRLLAAQ